MPFTIADISGALLTPAPSGLSGGAVTDTGASAGMGFKAFLGQLNRMIQSDGQDGDLSVAGQGTDAVSMADSCQDTGLSIFSGNDSHRVSSLNDNVSLVSLLGNGDLKTGEAFVRELRSLLLSVSNGNLDDISINQSGLDALADLLVNAGFDSGSIETVMADFTAAIDAGKTSVSMLDLMDKLLDLEEVDETAVAEQGLIIPSSDLPPIQAVLTLLGVDPSTISSMLDEADQGSQGIHVETFVQALRNLDQTAFDTGLSFQTAEGDTALTLFDQLGLDIEGVISRQTADMTGSQDTTVPQLSLGMLIRAFEQKLADTLLSVPGLPVGFQASSIDTGTVVQADDSSLNGQDLMARLFAGLELSSARDINTMQGKTTIEFQAGESFKSQVIRSLNAAGNPGATRENAGAGNTVRTDESADETVTAGLKAGNVSQAGAENNAVRLTGATLGQDGPGDADTGADLAGRSGDAGKVAGEDSLAAAGAGEKIGTVSGSRSAISSDRVSQSFASLPDHVTRQVGKGLVRAINMGENSLRIQLKPPELGRVFMQIDNSGDTMKVSIITEHQSAKDILAANINEIKTVLSAAGISLESFEVDMSSDFRQSMADARGQNQAPRKKGAKASGSTRDTEEDHGNQTAALSGSSGTGQTLHFVA